MAQPAPLAYDYFRGEYVEVGLRRGVGKFGDKFRTERERRGIKLDDVSNSTKIGSRMLRAIEEEHFDQLPGGVFNKGFIRAYAKYLGLDEEETITGYVAALNQFNSQQWGEEKPAQQPSTTGRTPTRPAPGPSASNGGECEHGSQHRDHCPQGDRRADPALLTNVDGGQNRDGSHQSGDDPNQG